MKLDNVKSEDKKILLYLTALGFVNTNISAIGLKEAARKSSKYSFNPEDVEKAIRKADQAWQNISIGNGVEWNFNEAVKENLLSLIDEAIVQISTSIETVRKVECENQKQIPKFLSDNEQNLDYLRRTINSL